MSVQSPLLLIGVGGAGSAMARGVCRAFGEDIRRLSVDTDAISGVGGEPFVLLGGDRLSGRGAGGNIVNARTAAEESVDALDEHLEGVRLAVVVTALGGGTGGGATLVIVKHLADRGITSIVFATTPFAFEGDDRMRNAHGMISLIEEASSASFILPLDKLIQGEDNMDAALARAVDTVASGVTLFWRLLEKPGYLRTDVERIRHLISGAGRGRFAAVTVSGETRATDAVDRLTRSELLATGSGAVRTIFLGVLAGEDLRLSEIGRLADGVRAAFGGHCAFELATVNDEATFSGRLCVIALLFESDGRNAAAADKPGEPTPARKGRRGTRIAALGVGPQGRGRFNNAEPTVWHGEDLDIPTFVRRNMSLEF